MLQLCFFLTQTLLPQFFFQVPSFGAFIHVLPSAMPPRREPPMEDIPPSLNDLVNQLITATNTAASNNTAQLTALVETMKSLNAKIDSQTATTANLVTHITTLSDQLIAGNIEKPSPNILKPHELPSSSNSNHYRHLHNHGLTYPWTSLPTCQRQTVKLLYG